MPTVYDGISAFEAQVGEHLGYSDWHDVTQKQIDLFADATGDHQWIHVDAEKAAAGPYGRRSRTATSRCRWFPFWCNRSTR